MAGVVGAVIQGFDECEWAHQIARGAAKPHGIECAKIEFQINLINEGEARMNYDSESHSHEMSLNS